MAFSTVEHPLAPRLSGTLLCGVCNIYDQKTYFLYLDVLALFKKLFQNQKSQLSLAPTTASTAGLKARRQAKKKDQKALQARRGGATAIEEMLAQLHVEPLAHVQDLTFDLPQPQTDSMATNLLESSLDGGEAENDLAMELEAINYQDNVRGSHGSFFQDSAYSFELDENEDHEDDDDMQHAMTTFEDISHHEDAQSAARSIEYNLRPSEYEAVALPGDSLFLDATMEFDVDAENVVIQIPEDEGAADKTPSPREILEEERDASAEHKLVRHRQRRAPRAKKSGLTLDESTILSAKTLKEWEKPHLAVSSASRTPSNYYGSCSAEAAVLSSRLSSLFNSIRAKKAQRFRDGETVAVGSTHLEPYSQYQVKFSADPPSRPSSLGTGLGVPGDSMNERLPSAFNEIERLRGIFEINDEQRYENTAMRFQMKRDTVLRPSYNEDASSRASSAFGYKDGALPDTMSQSDLFRRSNAPNGRDSVASLSVFPEWGMGGTPSSPPTLLSDFGFKHQGNSTGSHVSSFGQPAHAYTMETWKFRNLIKSHFRKSANKSNQIAFFDIVPVQQVTSLVAARSFYHLLVLISSGDFEVRTDPKSNEIFISNPVMSSLGDSILDDDTAVEGLDKPYSESSAVSQKIALEL